MKPVPFCGTGFSYLPLLYMKFSLIHRNKFFHLGFLLDLFFCFPTELFAATPPLSINLRAGDYQEKLSGNDVSAWFHVETKLTKNANARKSEIEDTSYCPTDKMFCSFSISRHNRSRLSVIFQSEPNEESIGAFVASFSGKVNQEPVDAIFGTDGEDKITVAQEEKLGRYLNEAQSVALLVKVLNASSEQAIEVTLPTETVEPKIMSSDKERLGLKELIGRGTTNFRGSPKNRIFNINRALKQFQNVMIAPGEEFSFVKNLGEVDGEHGYLPELVIKNNRTEPEFGGGICQVSTTVFRAAIYSGLKVSERKNHAYPVQYYKPYGMDATIYIPKPDLKFKNNTPGYILMQYAIDGTNLTFSFFGTKDGRSIAIDGPHILESNPDGSMKTVFSQTVTDNSGQVFINDSFWSNYKSPSLFPHPNTNAVLTEKPKDWSDKQWKEYQKIH